MDIEPILHKLREDGYRLTPQRLAILQILENSGRHLTPLEIYHGVEKTTPGITEATVYRTLNFLVEQNLLLAAHIGNGQLVYEMADHRHDHLICRSCGKTVEVDHADLQPLYERFETSTGFRIDSVHQTFFGLCPHCQGEKD